jgi:hypothetical protein
VPPRGGGGSFGSGVGADTLGGGRDGGFNRNADSGRGGPSPAAVLNGLVYKQIY